MGMTMLAAQRGAEFGSLTQYFLKAIWEVLATPFTDCLVGFWKHKENQDYFDIDTNFTAFWVKVLFQLLARRKR